MNRAATAEGDRRGSPITSNSPKTPSDTTCFVTASGHHAPETSRCVTPKSTIANSIREKFTAVGPIRRPAAVNSTNVAVHSIAVATPAR